MIVGLSNYIIAQERKSTTTTGDIEVGGHGNVCDRWLNLTKKGAAVVVVV